MSVFDFFPPWVYSQYRMNIFVSNLYPQTSWIDAKRLSVMGIITLIFGAVSILKV